MRTINRVNEVPLRDYPDYLVNIDGEIRRIGARRVMKGRINRNGYRQYTFTKNGESSTKEAHRLILLSFHPISNYKEMYINHKNGIKDDNRLENLEWATRSDNTKHSYRKGLQKKVTNQYGSFRVLSETELKKVEQLHLTNYIDREIAEQLGCSRTLVSRKIREMGYRNNAV